MGLLVFTRKRVSLLAVRLLAFSYFNILNLKKKVQICNVPSPKVYLCFFLSFNHIDSLHKRLEGL